MCIDEYAKKMNESKVIVTLIFSAIFLIMLYCNFLTPLVADDYQYCYSFKDGSRIDSIADIFDSMRYHRINTNGRVIPHFFVQLFLMLPLPIFKVLNTIVFNMYIYIYYYSLTLCSPPNKKMQHNALLLLSIMGTVWVFSPSFGSIYLWLDGSCNYLWGTTILLFWLFIMAKDFIADLTLTPVEEFLFAVLSLIVGNFAENSSVAAVFIMLIFIVLSIFYQKRKLKRWHITSLCTMLIGFFLLALSPAGAATKIASPSLSTYINHFFELICLYLKFWPLIFIYALSYWYSVKTNQPKNIRILSLVCISGSLAAHFVLVFALYIADRSTIFSFSLLLVACIILFGQLFRTKIHFIYCFLSVILLISALYCGILGIQDLRTVHYRWSYNDVLIRDAVAAGESKVKVPYVVAHTKYSCLYNGGYLQKDTTHWINAGMAKYYGAEELSGFWFYDTE